ncbi:acyl-CoA dehydrogenase family protein [Streptomyces sp. NPDC000151]|uniref:acyl-CoA dehydrogenase family protein n=1 Tax=Streptomyces sp. NPDC000151 TaxID=3154244 RepID=UPI003321DBC2
MTGLDELYAALAADAAHLEASRELPYKSVELVRRSGLGALRVPARHGGRGGTFADLFRIVIDLAAADSNVAQALRPHFGFVEQLISQGGDAERERWFPAVVAGALIGNAASERGTAHPGDIETRLTRSPDEDDAYRLNGTKFYSTGSLFADHVLVTALDEDDQRVRVLLPSDREGLRLLDDWDSMGQRTTASGTTVLEDVRVLPDEIIIEGNWRERRTHLAPYFQLYLAAVQTGIAKNALSDAVAHARDKARAVQHAGVARAVEDPLVQHAVGEIAALAYGAEATVLRAAAAVDDALAETGPDGIAGTEEALHDAAVQVAQAQVVAAQASLRAAERLYDVGGASATLREHNFDRHWRNARTLSSHNPIPHKARVAGDYHLNGRTPPLNGFF